MSFSLVNRLLQDCRKAILEDKALRLSEYQLEVDEEKWRHITERDGKLVFDNVKDFIEFYNNTDGIIKKPNENDIEPLREFVVNVKACEDQIKPAFQRFEKNCEQLVEESKKQADKLSERAYTPWLMSWCGTVMALFLVLAIVHEASVVMNVQLKNISLLKILGLTNADLHLETCFLCVSTVVLGIVYLKLHRDANRLKLMSKRLLEFQTEVGSAQHKIQVYVQQLPKVNQLEKLEKEVERSKVKLLYKLVYRMFGWNFYDIKGVTHHLNAFKGRLERLKECCHLQNSC